MNQQNSDDKARRRILQYASRKFATSGYSHVSIAQFASELKMSKSTLYKYFQSKEELLNAVIDDFYSSFEQEIDKIAMDPGMNITQKIQAFLLIVRQRFASVQVSAIEDMQRAAPEAYERLEERRKGIITGNLIRLFEQGARDGYFRKDIPPVIIANLLLNALQHLEHPQFMTGTSYTFTDMFQHVFSILLEGSLSDDGRKEFRK
ncbi:TetR/AcrR family transcriptional regulator [Cohnella suwonensis]|uniref:TetR/AcrR family transcriptional regulator n=1 Tax=Cohnella suwonensis TaxID=696072 RepID=A0ABW0M2W1_9BACL